MSCSVVNCPSIPGKDLSFFNFPDPNSQECKVWIKFCGQDDDWRIKRGYQICELHFRHSDKTGELSKKSLKDGALPEHSTLCPFIESSCRVCLTEIPTGLLPLFSTFIDDVAVGSILEYCTSVEIRPTDSFPKFICQECLMKMENAREFKDLTLKTDDKLRNHFLFVQDIIAQKQISVVKQEKE